MREQYSLGCLHLASWVSITNRSCLYCPTLPHHQQTNYNRMSHPSARHSLYEPLPSTTSTIPAHFQIPSIVASTISPSSQTGQFWLCLWYLSICICQRNAIILSTSSLSHRRYKQEKVLLWFPDIDAREGIKESDSIEYIVRKKAKLKELGKREGIAGP